MDKLLTLDEAAKALGMTRRSFRQSFISGTPKIPFIKLNQRNYRIKEKVLENFISACEIRPDSMVTGSKKLK